MKTLIWFFASLAIIVFVVPGCADRCEQTAENHCKRYSEEELKNIFGTNMPLADALKECIEGRIQDKCAETK